MSLLSSFTPKNFDAKKAARRLRSRLNIANSLSTSLISMGRGTHVVTDNSSNRPEKMLELYDIENCPYCRMVREVITELDLDVVIYPCPKKGGRFRNKVVEMGGKQQFPFLHDPNTNTKLYESIDIIRYLRSHYGTSSSANSLIHHLVKTPTSIMSSLLRLDKGLFSANATEENAERSLPKERLKLFGFESSPFARTVRECLCELELPYELYNVGKHEWKDYLLTDTRAKYLPDHIFSSKKRQNMVEEAGKVMVPYLIDPNTNTRLFHSNKICAYLREHYSAINSKTAAVA